MTPRENPNKANFGGELLKFALGLLSVAIIASVGFLFTAVNGNTKDIVTAQEALKYLKEKFTEWVQAEKEWHKAQKERDDEQDEEIEKLKEYRRRHNEDE